MIDTTTTTIPKQIAEVEFWRAQREHVEALSGALPGEEPIEPVEQVAGPRERRGGVD